MQQRITFAGNALQLPASLEVMSILDQIIASERVLKQDEAQTIRALLKSLETAPGIRWDDDSWYKIQDIERHEIASVATLAAWRSDGQGPAWSKFSRCVLYKGADLKAFLAANRRAGATG